MSEDTPVVQPHDVYSYGVISSSTLYRLQGEFPAAEGYGEIEAAQFVTGGEAANSSVVLARLGLRVKLDGNWLGADENGKRTRSFLSDCGIDTTRLALRKGYAGVQEIVFAARGTRTIFGTYGRLLEQEDWNEPEESDITAARVVCLDPFFAEPAVRVGAIAADARIPVVTVDCEFSNKLLQYASAVVIAESYIRETYGDRDLDELFAAYTRATQGLVVFTFGDAPVRFGRAGDPARFQQPYSIDPTDTTGGGDSFRAGVVYGLSRGWSDDDTIRFAAAVAAINCTRFPGVMHSPPYDEVVDFMTANSP